MMILPPILTAAALAGAAPSIDTAEATQLVQSCADDACEVPPEEAGEAVFVVIVDAWVRFGVADADGAATVRALAPELFDALPEPLQELAGAAPEPWAAELLAAPSDPAPVPTPVSSEEAPSVADAPPTRPAPTLSTHKAVLKIIRGSSPEAAPEPVLLTPVHREAPSHPNTTRRYRVQCVAGVDVGLDGKVTDVQVDPDSCPPTYAESVEEAFSRWKFATQDAPEPGPWHLRLKTNFIPQGASPLTWAEARAAWAELAPFYTEVPSTEATCQVGFDIAASGALVGLTTSDPDRCLALTHDGARPYTASSPGDESTRCTVRFRTQDGQALLPPAFRHCPRALRSEVKEMVKAWTWMDLELGEEKYEATFRFE